MCLRVLMESEWCDASCGWPRVVLQVLFESELVVPLAGLDYLIDRHEQVREPGHEVDVRLTEK